MADDEDFGRRLRDARRDYERRHDRYPTDAEVGRAVGKHLGRGPFTPQVVGRWFKGREPGEFIATVRALAAFFEVSAGWLATGEGDMQAAPATPERAGAETGPGLERVRSAERPASELLRELEAERRAAKKRGA